MTQILRENGKISKANRERVKTFVDWFRFSNKEKCFVDAVAEITNLLSQDLTDNKPEKQQVSQPASSKAGKEEKPERAKYTTAGIEDFSDIYSGIISKGKLLAWAKRKDIQGEVLEQVRYVGSEENAPKEAVLFILYAYMNQIYVHRASHPLTKRRLSIFLQACLQSLQIRKSL